MHKEQVEEKEEDKKEETIPGWIKISVHSIKRIRERVNNYVDNGWYSKVDNKSIKMIPIKKFYKIWSVESLIMQKRLGKCI